MMFVYTGDPRPCIVQGERAIFNGWGEFEKPVKDAYVTVGVIRGVMGVVELSDGHVKIVAPNAIQFLDSATEFAKYDWGGTDEQPTE